jgi:hypothetical protein
MVAHRLNWVEFTNAEANGARRYSSPFLFAPFFFGLGGSLSASRCESGRAVGHPADRGAYAIDRRHGNARRFQ